MNRMSLVFACSILLGACGERGAEVAASNNLVVTEATPAAEPDADNHQQPEAPGQADPAPIPAPFRGTWAETQADCGDPAHISRLVISGTTLRFYESLETVARVERLGPREINIYVTATGEGTTRPAEHHFSLDAAGDTLTDEGGGGMVRRRCGA